MGMQADDSALSGIDLSHLTEEERQIIMSVTMRATQVDQDREEKIRYPQRELEEEIASKEKIKSAGGSAANNPAKSSCQNCGVFTNQRCASCPDPICQKCVKIPNGKKICPLCQKRNDLVAQSNEWIKKPGQMRNSQSDVPKMRTDDFEAGSQRRTNSLHGMNKTPPEKDNLPQKSSANPSTNPRQNTQKQQLQSQSQAQSHQKSQPKPLPRGRSIDNSKQSENSNSLGKTPAQNPAKPQETVGSQKQGPRNHQNQPQNQALSNSPQPPSIFKRQPSLGSIAGPPQPRGQPEAANKLPQDAPKQVQQAQKPLQNRQQGGQQPIPKSNDANQPRNQQAGPPNARQNPQSRPQNQPQRQPEPQPKSIFSSIFGSDPIPQNPPPKPKNQQPTQTRPQSSQNPKRPQTSQAPPKQASSASLFEQSSLPTFDLMPRKSASVNSDMANSQGTQPPGSLMPDEKIKPPNYDLSPRKAKSIVPKSQLSPSPNPKSIFDTPKMPNVVQNGRNTEESKIITDMPKFEKNIDKEAEALSIVSEIDKMKQNESQKMQQKVGPAETGSLREHKEAQLSKFNSRIANQPVFPPNYLEFDSSDSSLGCDEDLALRKREFNEPNFPEPMKKLESPKVGENFSVLETAKQFNENDEINSLSSSKMSNAFRHFDFEDDGEGDFENFEMSLKLSAASSGHTLPKSNFEVPVSKKFDQFGRRKSDELKKDQLKKSGSGNFTKIGGTSSADGLDKVGQRAAVTSSMKRTTSFEAFKAVDSYGSMKRSSSRKKDLTVTDQSIKRAVSDGQPDRDLPIKRESLTGTLSKCLFCGKGALESAKDVEYSSSRSSVSLSQKIGAVARSSIAIQVQPVSRSSCSQVNVQKYSESTQTYQNRSFGVDQAVQVQMLSSIQAPKIAEPLQNHQQQQQQTSQNQILDTPINSRRPRARHFSARSNRSRSSSQSRVSHSRRSSVFSDNEATEELSNCVRDLVNEVRELVNSRNPSPLHNQRYDQPQISPSFTQQNQQNQQSFQQAQPVFQPIIQPQLIPQMIPIPQPYPVSYPAHPPPPAHVTYYSSPQNSQFPFPPATHSTVTHNQTSSNLIQQPYHTLPRPDSRRRLPEPPAGVAPVTLQPIGQANAQELEHRMVSIKQRVEALDKEEKELDHRLKELQRKSCNEQARGSLHGYSYQDNMKPEIRSSLPEAQQDHRFQ